MNLRYRIPEISAMQVLPAITERDGQSYLYLDPDDLSRDYLVNQTLQDDCPMFFQAMRVLGEKINAGGICDALFHAFAYVDFSGVFDRTPIGRTLELQQKAEKLFRPEGLWIDLGKGYQQYLAFERSASMSRNCKLSFVRADLCKPLQQRMMLDMHIGKCQLSKLYAYNGLMFTGGRRVEISEMMDEKHIILIDNPKKIIENVKTITVNDDGTNNPVRTYTRVEEIADIKITEFDGEGLISPDLAYILDPVKENNHPHHSFQIRMPYIKGVVHEVDFKTLFAELGVTQIQDIFGQLHYVRDVDMILTKSMFKGFGWMRDNGISWGEYLRRCNQYEHGLYISGMDSLERRSVTELNYQFLVTANITQEEFRPADLPMGWKKAPPVDRQWLTKATEEAYWSYVGDIEARQSYFTKIANDPELELNSKKKNQAKLLEMNPLFLGEPIFAKELQDKAENILTKYENANLLVAGDNRFLSGDLFWLMSFLLDPAGDKTDRHSTYYSKVLSEQFPEDAFYAPGAQYSTDSVCTILRNPHIARNEEIQLRPYTENYPMRNYYFGHLTDVLMSDNQVLAAERLGGADYDGDMVKTIASPIVNQCVRKNYDTYGDKRTNMDNIPLLMIPSIDPLIRDANDWQARFKTVKNTFSSRVGQISNAALNRSIIAYNENSTAEERERYRQEVEILAILTGLEIDSAKSGVKPDLSEYLGAKDIKRSRFLRFKDIMDATEEQRKWYEPTPAERLKAYYEKIDWSKVDSNLEKLPYLAYQLERHTPKKKPRKNMPSDLYTFAVPGGEKRLYPTILSAVSALVQDYKHCLQRIRASRQPIKERSRQSDIAKILFARCQEDDYDTDTLYVLFSALSQEQVTELYRAIRDNQWHLMPENHREAFLRQYLPEEFEDCFDLLTDFRCSGYRILGDFICDCMDTYRLEDQRKLHSEQDSPAMTAMLDAYPNKTSEADYKTAVALECRKQLETFVKAGEAVKYAVAIKDKDFLWDILYDKIYDHVKRAEVSRDAE